MYTSNDVVYYALCIYKSLGVSSLTISERLHKKSGVSVEMASRLSSSSKHSLASF